MQLGAVLPHNEIGNDPGAIKAYLQGVEDLGMTHLLIYDHVMGADPNRPGGFKGPYDKDIAFHEPFGFHDYNRLQLSAACVLSDSGTIAEESTILGFPAITLRDSIERPEALDTSGIIMTGLDAHDVVEAITVALANKPAKNGVSAVTPNDYLIDNTSSRAVNFILSTAHRHKSWAGLRG